MVLGCLIFADGQVPSMLIFENGSVCVTGLKFSEKRITWNREAEWKTILPFYTHEAWIKKIDQPISGTWTLMDDNIMFKPDFPFSPGEIYHAIFDSQAFYKHVPGSNASTSEKLELTFSLPKKESLHTSIDAVYPTSTTVPENLLRMYICFSSPMMPGEAYDHITLLHEDGTKVERPFLIVDQELWDAERKRFTLLFDPGRIKRTLKANLDLGSPLKQGQTYQLAIDSTWRDVNGNPLQGSFRKKFSVTFAQRTKLSKEVIKVVSPKTNSREVVILTFDRPIDHVLLSKSVSVTNSSTGEISGQIRMVNDFTWTFTPDQAWTSGQYEVAMSPWVEDVCGNNFNNAFDLDLKKEKRIMSDDPIKLSFVVKTLDQ
jgi:hypothetical protein